jgi:DNA-directed RNA polymerase specialized sigma24 family protein
MMPKCLHEVFTDSESNDKPEACLSRLRWLCSVLIDDEELTDKILVAAREQTGLGAEQASHDLLATWARRLVIKDCIAAVRPWNSIATRQTDSHSWARLTQSECRHLQSVFHSPSYVLRMKLRRLSVLARFVLVLRGLEGYSRAQTSILLNIEEEECDAAFVKAALAMTKDSQRPKESPLSIERARVDEGGQMCIVSSRTY